MRTILPIVFLTAACAPTSTVTTHQGVRALVLDIDAIPLTVTGAVDASDTTVEVITELGGSPRSVQIEQDGEVLTLGDDCGQGGRRCASQVIVTVPRGDLLEVDGTGWDCEHVVFEHLDADVEFMGANGDDCLVEAHDLTGQAFFGGVADLVVSGLRGDRLLLVGSMVEAGIERSDVILTMHASEGARVSVPAGDYQLDLRGHTPVVSGVTHADNAPGLLNIMSTDLVLTGL